MFQYCLTTTTLFYVFLIQPVKLKETLCPITQPIDHAEGPIWDHRKDILYYVDLYAGVLNGYHFFTKQIDKLQFDGTLNIITPTKHPDLLLLGLNRTIVAIEWNGRTNLTNYKELVTVSQQYPTSRFNDGKADCNGILWYGTMGYEAPKTGKLQTNEGVLYRIDENYQQPQIIIQPVNISNGLVWNRDNNKFFYIDSPSRRIMAYEFNKNTSTIHDNGTILFDLSQHQQLNGVPDGMTIDIDENLWVALFGGHSIIQIDSKTGRLLRQITIPARDVTSVMWGGPLFDILYITTSRFNLNQTEREQQPLAGSVFALEGLNTKGYKINLANIINAIS